MLPESAKHADFDIEEGKTGWSEYKQIAVFENYSLDQAYEAAKSALGDADFALLKANKEEGVVMGEHGYTWEDWNVIAGVYLKKEMDKIRVLVIAEGSKDFGFGGDTTGDGWTGKIIEGMRRHLSSYDQ
jgi:cell division GTPase FtsZ